MKKVLVVGAGVAGPILAIQLKQTGFEPVVFEARSAEQTHEGLFLGLTPNGLNVLRQFVPLERLHEHCTAGKMAFFNGKGQRVAELPTAPQLEKYGAQTVQVRRSDLNRLVREAAVEQGIEFHFGRQLVGLDETETTVTARFQDGSTATGDLLVGSDGMFSTVRRLIFPGLKAVKYTETIATGGYARLPECSQPLDEIRMTFCRRGFFAYTVSNRGEVWWFNNFYRQNEPTPGEISGPLREEIRSTLLWVHRHDDPLFVKIIEKSHEIMAYPVYDVPRLANWHRGRVCLLGDAAHGISPHIGQGAALALEDTEVLTRCLKTCPDVRQAFEKFQQLRQPRVEKIVGRSRKIGHSKTRTNPVAAWFRDRLLGFFIKKEMEQLDWVYGYQAERGH